MRSVAVVTNFLKFDIDELVIRYGLIIHSLSKCLDVYSKEGKVRVEAEVESQEEGEVRVEAKVEGREEGVSREEGESRDEGRVEIRGESRERSVRRGGWQENEKEGRALPSSVRCGVVR